MVARVAAARSATVDGPLDCFAERQREDHPSLERTRVRAIHADNLGAIDELEDHDVARKGVVADRARINGRLEDQLDVARNVFRAVDQPQLRSTIRRASDLDRPDLSGDVE
jgi:hypothetical protein